ncbi:MAG: hypothetical protein K8R50_10345 [Betaproteobacteria bacterium]|nr:hypothetical protein [Betaproteobacteria bacterium]
MAPQDQYVLLFPLLADYWDKPFSKLPKALQARISTWIVGWDQLRPIRRRNHVLQVDYKNAPARAGERPVNWFALTMDTPGWWKMQNITAGERLVTWYDLTMDARSWWEMQNVTPVEAALLLCGINPIECADIQLVQLDGDQFDIDYQYKLLLRIFEGEASTAPQPRILMEWLTIAKQRTLCYDAGIYNYADAMGAHADAPAAKNDVRLSVTDQQNNAILKWLRDNKYDPLKIPVPSPGKAGVKKLCRNGVKFSSSSVFDTAWDRLRSDGEIKDEK